LPPAAEDGTVAEIVSCPRVDTVSAYARRLLEADDLDTKLAPPPAGLPDEPRAPATRVAAPARPAKLAIASSRAVKVPPLEGMRDPTQRGRILHALANHELQAAELFAWALLAFPQAPASFRRGLLGILADEQRHCRMYLARLAALGGRFGDYPVTGHFWNKLDGVKTPLQFVCTMGLTFENANLDFANEYAAAARDAGDAQTAAILEEVHDDEVRHVAFAWRWLSQLAGDGDARTIYLANVDFPLGPARARGVTFDRDSRRRAGLDEAFIEMLAASAPKRPGGAPRSR
jgi:uncharacterized ferritin-like protein (DUF455 family)